MVLSVNGEKRTILILNFFIKFFGVLLFLIKGFNKYWEFLFNNFLKIKNLFGFFILLKSVQKYIKSLNIAKHADEVIKKKNYQIKLNKLF